jgi:hypothetical protein
MSLIKRCALSIAVVGSTACGPDANEKSDWIVDTFSSRDVNDRTLGLSALEHYEFLENGTLLVSSVSECEENLEGEADEYNWTRDGDNLVIVEMPADSIFEEWRITPGKDCTRVRVDPIQHGETAGSYGLTRGEVCMQKLPPCPEGTSCESCETIWCDEPPPAPCEE